MALSGSFGYELDLNKVTKEEQDLVKEQIADFHRYYSLTHEGDYYVLQGRRKDFVHGSLWIGKKNMLCRRWS